MGSLGIVESMELRRMLAGNVTATIVGSDLVIRGDNKSNQIVLATHADSTTTVAPAPGTTVNGNGTATFDGFPNVLVNMGNGDDSVTLVDMFQSASIVTGNGSDTVIGAIDVFPPNVFFDLNIDTGNGNDLVHLGGFTGVFNDLNINTGNGDDVVEVVDATAVEGNHLSINTGNGADFVRLDDEFFVPGIIALDGGNGPDVLDISGAFGTAGGLIILNFETII
jgi:hypothetical protein